MPAVPDDRAVVLFEIFIRSHSVDINVFTPASVPDERPHPAQTVNACVTASSDPPAERTPDVYAPVLVNR